MFAMSLRRATALVRRWNLRRHGNMRHLQRLRLQLRRRRVHCIGVLRELLSGLRCLHMR